MASSGPTQQGAELVEGFQVGLCRAWGSISLGRETRGGACQALTVPFFPPQLLSWLIIYHTHGLPGQPPKVSEPPKQPQIFTVHQPSSSSLLPPHQQQRAIFDPLFCPVVRCCPQALIPIEDGLREGPCLSCPVASLPVFLQIPQLSENHMLDGLVKAVTLESLAGYSLGLRPSPLTPP